VGVPGVEADIRQRGLHELGVLAGLGVGGLELGECVRDVAMHGVIEERPLLVVGAQAIVDEADIDGVAARHHQHRLEARRVERLLGGGDARRQERERQDQAEGSALHGCAGSSKRRDCKPSCQLESSCRGAVRSSASKSLSRMKRPRALSSP
jgi:hypothetical protein